MARRHSSLSRVAHDVFQPDRHQSTCAPHGSRFVLVFGARSGEARHGENRAEITAPEKKQLDAWRTPCKLKSDVAQGCGDVDAEDRTNSTAASTPAELESQSSDELTSVDGDLGEESTFETEMRSLTAQLMSAKEEARMWKLRKENYLLDAAAERTARIQAEEQVAKLKPQCKSLERENSTLKNETTKLAKENVSLKQKLLQRSKSASVRGSSRPWRLDELGKMKPSNDTLVHQMADMECAPLQQCSAVEKAALKKKLLLKWHPDRQPSTNHAIFATRVMQEMQNRPVWTN